MHGNPHALTAHSFSQDRAAADSRLTLWLGFPIARAHFDPSNLSEADQARLAGARGSRRRADFEVSRALLAAADIGSAGHSMSHSAEHAALLVAPADLRIGVDLEINRPRDVLRLARFAFDEREVRALEAAPPEQQQRLFYTLWTLKESFAKALQLSLIDALRACVFWIEGEEWRGAVPIDAAWGATVFQPRPEIFVAAAWIGTNEPMSLDQWEWPPKQRAEWPLTAGCAGVPSGVASAPG